MKAARVALLFLPLCSLARAEPASYQIDPNHTHPLVEVDHFGGLSTWRGLFRSTTGTVTLDREAGTGTFDVRIDTASIDFGHDLLNKVALAPKIGEWNGLDAARYPSADAVGHFNRADFGVNAGLQYGFSQDVTLRIQVEAIRRD
jgi:polyisoprenoid-binding protein YceI